MLESELGRLKIIGLGPKGINNLTLQAYRKLKQVDKLFVRTDKHSVISYLEKEEGIDFITFDELLICDYDFDQLVDEIFKQLQDNLDKNIDIGYAVPGNPLVGDKLINELLVKLSNERIEVIPGIDSLQLLKNNLELDSNSVQVIDSFGFKSEEIDVEKDLVITNISNQKTVFQLKKELLEIYPPDHSIQVIESGVNYTIKNSKFLLCNLDDLEDIEELINFYIPALTERLDIGLDKLGSLKTLVKVVAKLRSPEGCPWDLEQTHLSLRPHLIEETYEVLERIDLNDTAGLCEELGDLLLHVVFHAQLANEKDDFNIEDVIRSISEKMIRRHPHVFGAKDLDTSDEVIEEWEAIKATEKKSEETKESILDITRGLPALMEAQQIQSKAAKVGFDWKKIEGAVDKLKEELEEFEEALIADQKDRVREELGDLLFAIVNVGRFLDLDLELVLHDASCKFKNRFRYIEEKTINDELNKMSLNELEELWQKAKIKLEEEKINEKSK
ncbi:nucleoside triphosphate pyrophosphohydrolase [Sporohalobacter salinus]|uniref:nucleoside triphosphate pyrophosphohydrolase n=1 Tax=Sporohalobacter salinus TaxID=1494606 RepID=UPI0019611E1A|nr:nucleoside triphosphate pyrophosphohydrolase [Sporohalobacter salinus]MBM7623887.1 tetrapyrrole methylase family protein/MazG family protein [Sporohalobacter salinus]